MPSRRTQLITYLPCPVSHLVVRSTSYIDTVEIQQPRDFPPKFIKHVAEDCGGLYGPTLRRLYENCGTYSLFLQQPGPRALKAITGVRQHIVRVTVSLDLLTETRSEAFQVHDWLEQHLVTEKAPTTRILRVGRSIRPTTYFGTSTAYRRGKSLAIYSDKPSKVTETPCCHLDWRMSGAELLRAAGLREAKGLLTLNHRKFWSERLDLQVPPSSDQVGRAWLKWVPKSPRPVSRILPWGGRVEGLRRIGEAWLRDARLQDNWELCCSDLRYYWSKWAKPFLALNFPAVDCAWMLPPLENGYWLERTKRTAAPSHDEVVRTPEIHGEQNEQ